jgi:FixJ family two-component response regulator
VTDVSPPLVAIVAAGEVMRDALTASLAARGFLVEGFESLQAFLERARHRAPFCLIVDLVGSSRETCERGAIELKKAVRDLAPALPLVVLTSHAEMARGGLTLQPNLSILVKPVAPDLLSAVVGRALRAPSS